MGICFLKHLRGIGHLVSPFELQRCQAFCTLFDQIYFLLVIGSPKVELLMQPFVEIRLAPFSNDVVLPQRTNILPNGQRRKCPDNSIADSIVAEIPFPGFRNLLTEIPRVCSQPIDNKAVCPTPRRRPRFPTERR